MKKKSVRVIKKLPFPSPFGGSSFGTQENTIGKSWENVENTFEKVSANTNKSLENFFILFTIQMNRDLNLFS